MLPRTKAFRYIDIKSVNFSKNFNLVYPNENSGYFYGISETNQV